MTVIELLLITVCVVGVVAFLVLPALSRPHARAPSVGSRCMNNLRQIGLAARIYSNDHGDKFPWATTSTNGGSIDFADSPQVFRHYVAMSNELSFPKILFCDSDTGRQRAVSWTNFSNSNISYFLALTADEQSPQSLLAGDRQITGGALSNGFMMTLTATSTVTWRGNIHNNVGHVVLADGSAMQLLSMTRFTNSAPMRLAIP